MFISPKQKNTVLEMALKSFILSKLDHQMSKSWKWIVAHHCGFLVLGNTQKILTQIWHLIWDKNDVEKVKKRLVARTYNIIIKEKKIDKTQMVFNYQNCSFLLWEKNVLVIKKNFWNSRLKAKNLQNFWDH